MTLKGIKAIAIALSRHYVATTRHKWFVLRAGLKVGAPIAALLVHDMSKYGIKEAFGYAGRFYGASQYLPKDVYVRAWLHHQNHNEHHPQYWIIRSDNGTSRALEMPENVVREMVADWLGASRAYEGQWPKSRMDWPWLQQSFRGLRVHPNTRILASQIIDDYFAKEKK